MSKIFYIITIVLLLLTTTHAYNYANQAELNALTKGINRLNEQHKILHQRYLAEKKEGISYSKSKKYIKMLNSLRERAVLFMDNRNNLIKDKKRFISKREKELLALYAAEDRGPSISSIIKMKGKLKVAIDLSQQKMKLYKGSQLLYTWQVSTARGGYVTPAGRYKPYHTEKMHYSKLYDNSPMPYSVFFKEGYAIHGTHYVRSLGGRASHGCVRLRTSNAKKLYTLIKKTGYSNTAIEVKQ